MARVFVRQKLLWIIPMTVVPNIAAQPVLLSLVHPLLIKADAPTAPKVVITVAAPIPDNVV